MVAVEVDEICQTSGIVHCSGEIVVVTGDANKIAKAVVEICLGSLARIAALAGHRAALEKLSAAIQDSELIARLTDVTREPETIASSAAVRNHGGGHDSH